MIGHLIAYEEVYTNDNTYTTLCNKKVEMTNAKVRVFYLNKNWTLSRIEKEYPNTYICDKCIASNLLPILELKYSQL